jgi:hypothetical protein
VLTIIENGSKAWAVAATNGDLRIYSREQAGMWSELPLSEESEQIDDDGSVILEALYERQTEQPQDEETDEPEAEEEEPAYEEEEPGEEEEEPGEEEEEPEEEEEEPEEEEEEPEDEEEEPEEETPRRSRGTATKKDPQAEKEAKPRPTRGRTKARK